MQLYLGMYVCFTIFTFMVSYLIVFDLPTYYMHLNLHKIREIQLYLNFHFTSFFLYLLHFLFFRGDIFDESSGRREFTFKRTIKYGKYSILQIPTYQA